MIFRGVAFAILLGIAGSDMYGSDISVPPEVQMQIFAKIWTFDRTFVKDRTPTVGILYQARYRESLLTKEAIVAAAEDQHLGIRFVFIDVNPAIPILQQLPDDPLDVLYVAPLRAIDIDDIVPATRRRGIRTITGVTQYVEAGVAVGLGVSDGRPQIVINLSAAKVEGSDFSAQLLKLARIVR